MLTIMTGTGTSKMIKAETIRIATWNCKGIKTKLDFLNIMLKNEKWDIILLQETWLFEFDKFYCDNIHPDYCGISHSSINSTEYIKGRPYGGLAFLWKKTLSPFIQAQPLEDPRISSTILSVNYESMEIFNVYFPTADDAHGQSDYLSRISMYCDKSDYSSILIGGDFNCDPLRHKRKFLELKDVCNINSLVMIDVKLLPKNTYTFHNNLNTAMSWIDHFAVTESLSNDCDVQITPATPSDHGILTVTLKVKTATFPNRSYVYTPRFNWSSASQAQLEAYSRRSEILLNNIKVRDLIESSKIEETYNMLCESLRQSEVEAVTRITNTNSNIPGWNKYVSQLYNNYKHAYLTWRQNCDYETLNQLNICKKVFKAELRKIVRNRKKIVSDLIASSCFEKDFGLFWRRVKNSSPKPYNSVTNILGNANGKDKILKQWESYYSEHFKSNRNIHDLKQINSTDFEEFTIDEVTEACKNLKKNKSRGPDDICIENILYSHNSVYLVVMKILNAIIKTSYIPKALTEVMIKPILKKKGLDGTNINNYRPIALATIMSKLLEHLILGRTLPYLVTTENQFGYKQKVGTEMAVFSLKEIINYYVNKNTPAYVLYLDATKAFDKVDHRILIQKLIKRNVPHWCINLLISWLDTQSFGVMWDSLKSDFFDVRRGVRQGGVMSGYLFAIYFDDLSIMLSNTGYGARYNTKIVNHIIYADDLCIITTTLNAMEALLEICTTYAKSHKLEFNHVKTKIQCFTPKYMFPVKDLIYIKHFDQMLRHSNEVTYLGCEIGSCVKKGAVRICDKAEIRKRVGELYKNANMIRSRFSSCSESVKIKLFSTYFSSIYCCSLWNLKINSSHVMRIAHNDALRLIFGLPRYTSAKTAFVNLGLNNIDYVLRNSIYSLMRRNDESSNGIITNIANCFNACSLYKIWKYYLFS